MIFFFRVNLNKSVRRKRWLHRNSSSVYPSIYLSFSSMYLFIHDLYLSGCSLIASTEVDLAISWNLSQWHRDEFIHSLSFQLFWKFFLYHDILFPLFQLNLYKIMHSKIHGICLKRHFRFISSFTTILSCWACINT